MEDIVSSIQGLLVSKKYTDLIIRCKEQKFKVHRAVVCTRSSVLAGMVEELENEMLTEINLDNDEVAVVAAMINFLYSGDYDGTGADRFQNIFPATSGPFVFNVKMCIAADVYNIPALHTLAAEKLGSEWDEDAFMEAQKLLWGKANCEVIRKIVAKMAFEHMEMLGKKGEFKKLLPEEGGFARYLLEAGQTIHTSRWQ